MQFTQSECVSTKSKTQKLKYVHTNRQEELLFSLHFSIIYNKLNVKKRLPISNLTASGVLMSRKLSDKRSCIFKFYVKM